MEGYKKDSASGRRSNKRHMRGIIGTGKTRRKGREEKMKVRKRNRRKSLIDSKRER